jgi:DNA polymerase-3 subunit epsilon
LDFGVIVDLETTGLLPQSDEILEIGMLQFGWEVGRKPFIVKMYGGLTSPTKAIPPEITKLTGIDAEMTRNQSIDWTLVRQWLTESSVAIAHNMRFDRGFLQARPELADCKVQWACSVRHIDWHAHGYQTARLNYLAADNGFVNPFAHRALFDCATTFRLIENHLEELIATSYEREILLRAVNAPFAHKDKLRYRGYRWDSELRVWQKTVFEPKLTSEREFLANEIYLGIPDVHEETVVVDEYYTIEQNGF